MRIEMLGFKSVLGMCIYVAAEAGPGAGKHREILMIVATVCVLLLANQCKQFCLAMKF